MTHFFYQRVLLVLAIATSLSALAPAHAGGLLRPSNGSVPPLSIKKQAVDVVIEGGYAITTVNQIFHNPNNQGLESHCSFPVPRHGTVAEFTVWTSNDTVDQTLSFDLKLRSGYPVDAVPVPNFSQATTQSISPRQ